MNRYLLCLLAAAPLLAWACFTSERAEILGQQHPDREFEQLAHRMHEQATIPYRFTGAAQCSEGQADLFACSGVSLAGWIELPALGGGSGSDNWGWRDLDSKRSFALMGRSNGVAFVEITEPENPRYLGNLPRPVNVADSVWTDIKTYRGYAYVVADAVSGHGMQVFNLKKLLTADPEEPATFSADTRYEGFNSAHNLVINQQSGFAYAVGSDTCAGGLHMIDLREPTEPLEAGCFADDGYTHDAQCVNYQGPDERFRGREICLASNEDTLSVIDVSDKQHPTLIGRHSYPQVGYTHQGWLDSSHRYFFINDELDELTHSLTGTRTLVMDLDRLDQVEPPAAYLAAGLSIDHNHYLVGDFLFQAHYTRGLRVLKLNDPASADFVEVAWFDTHPESDGLSFSGAWNVFPFFGNDIVLVSDINRGLFILRISDPDLGAALERVFSDHFAIPMQKVIDDG